METRMHLPLLPLLPLLLLLLLLKALAVLALHTPASGIWVPAPHPAAAPRPSLRAPFFLAATPSAANGEEEWKGGVLILDHLNLNHEKGRHDLLRAFYMDVLGLAPDPRKAENFRQGRKTLWMNAGAFQFHLPEANQAQRFEGVITVAYADVGDLEKRLASAPSILREDSSLFSWERGAAAEDTPPALYVRDPWGNAFRLIEDPSAADSRGNQPGDKSLALGVPDITIHLARGSNMAGIGRFYSQVLSCPIERESDSEVVVAVGPGQTLTFQCLEGKTDISHEDLEEVPEGLVNHGPHLSMYVADFSTSYQKAENLRANLVFVNQRFKRKAYNLQQAKEQCMFRLLDVVDPLEPLAPILSIEHEVRSCIQLDGSKYKSLVLDEVPRAVVR